MLTVANWQWADPHLQQTLGPRFLVVAAGGLTATVAARTRQRRQDDAVALQTRMATAATFAAHLVPIPPALEHFEVTTHYEPGEEGLAVGGDFIDTVELADGSAAFLIGDVCGHGPEAAALGVAARTAWRSLVRVLPGDPVAWLDELEVLFSTELSQRFITAIAGIVEPGAAAAVISCAGHPYPIVAGAPPRILQTDNDPPLGVQLPNHRRRPHRLELGGAPLLLVTDGAFESMRRPDGTRATIDAVTAALGVATAVGGTERLGDLADQLRPRGGYDDDVALLLIQPKPDRPHPSAVGA